MAPGRVGGGGNQQEEPLTLPALCCVPTRLCHAPVWVAGVTEPAWAPSGKPAFQGWLSCPSSHLHPPPHSPLALSPVLLKAEE